MSETVKVRDNGADSVVSSLGSASSNGKTADAGIIAETGATRLHTNANMTLAELAATHEFGLGVPRRSWLRDWVDNNIDAIKKRLLQAGTRIAKGKSTKDKELKKIARWAELELREYIAARIDPPNSARTVLQKGSDVPLVDTGEMFEAIGSRVK